MSDIRWVDVESNVEDSVMHFRNAIEIDREQRSERGDHNFYLVSMAFMHAMLAGHSSSERASTRILDILGESRPGGTNWHEALLNLLATTLENDGGRPALLSPALDKALNETRRFRHRAMHAYSDFAFDLAAPALDAAAIVIELLSRKVEAFRLKVDP